MKKRVLAQIITVAMIAGMLSGCGGNGENMGNNKTEGTTTGPESASSESKEKPETKAVLEGLGNYPERDLEIIIPYKVGGTTDLAVRGVLDAIPKEEFGKQVTVTNMVGGSGLIGTEHFLTKDADGYTLGLVNCDLVLNYVNGTTEINPSEAMIPLATVEQDPYLLLAGKDAPFQTFEECVAYAEEHPGEIVAGVTGVGTIPNLLGTIFENASLEIQSVPYDSAPDAIAGVLSGEVDLCISAMAPAVGNIESGNLIPIAVTSAERSPSSPDVPTMAEVDKRFANVNLISWIMIAAPAKTPDAIVAYMQEILSKAAVSDSYASIRKEFYFDPITLTVEEMADFITEQGEYYKSLIN